MSPANAEAAKSPKTAVVNNEAVQVLEAAQIDRQCVVLQLADQNIEGQVNMSKGNDSKKQNKKKPLKTLMEKRAAKRAKKENKGFSLPIK